MKARIYIYIDALGWEMAQDSGFLKEELPFRRKISSVLEAPMCALRTALGGSGEYPAFAYNPKDSPFKSLKYVKYFFGAGLHPKCLMNRKWTRRKVSDIISGIKGRELQILSMSYEHLPFFNTSGIAEIFCQKESGALKRLRNALDKSGLKFFISDPKLAFGENLAKLSNFLGKGEADFAFISSTDLGRLLIGGKCGATDIKSFLSEYSRDIRTLIKTLEKSGHDWDLRVISGYGLEAAKSKINLPSKIAELKLKFGSDYACVYGSSSIKFWYLNEAARDKIRNRLLLPDCRGKFCHSQTSLECDSIRSDIYVTDAGVQIEPNDFYGVCPAGACAFFSGSALSFAALLSSSPTPSNANSLESFRELINADIEELKGPF